MALCAPDRDEAIAKARESFEWYPKTGARQIATLTDWMAERNEGLGTYAYAADMKKTDDEGLLDLLTLEYLMNSNACVLGTPGGVHRGVSPVRGGRRRPPALPGQPVQGSPRVGDADHRADGHRGDPGLRGLSPRPAGAGPSGRLGLQRHRALRRRRAGTHPPPPPCTEAGAGRPVRPAGPDLDIERWRSLGI